MRHVCTAAFVLISTLCGVGLAMSAETTGTPTSTVEQDCALFSANVGLMMGLRQRGVLASKLMKMTDNPLVREYIMRAYEEPKYLTEESIENAEKEFENRAFLDCMRRIAK